MEKKDLLQYCIYYKGENHNYSSLNDKMKFFASVESRWINESVLKSKILEDTIDEYLSFGLRTFDQYDGTPLSLKAFLFVQFKHDEETDDIEAFKKLYNEYKKAGK